MSNDSHLVFHNKNEGIRSWLEFLFTWIELLGGKYCLTHEELVISLKAPPMPDSRVFFHYTTQKVQRVCTHFSFVKSLAIGLSTCQSTFNWYLIFYHTSNFFASVISDISESGVILGFINQLPSFHYFQPLCTDTKFSPYVIEHLSRARHCSWCWGCAISKQNRQKLLPLETYILFEEICRQLFMKLSIF